jgi:hypothetical protein
VVSHEATGYGRDRLQLQACGSSKMRDRALIIKDLGSTVAYIKKMYGTVAFINIRLGGIIYVWHGPERTMVLWSVRCVRRLAL